MQPANSVNFIPVLDEFIVLSQRIGIPYWLSLLVTTL
jgi:hypothetical protein